MTNPGYLILEDGTRFPRPALESDDHHSPAHAVAWYGTERMDRSDGLWLAACADAFGYLVANPTLARKKIAMIRRALQPGDPSQTPAWDGSVPTDDYGPWGGTEGCFGHCDPEGWYAKCHSSAEL